MLIYLNFFTIHCTQEFWLNWTIITNLIFCNTNTTFFWCVINTSSIVTFDIYEFSYQLQSSQLFSCPNLMIWTEYWTLSWTILLYNIDTSIFGNILSISDTMIPLFKFRLSLRFGGMTAICKNKVNIHPMKMLIHSQDQISNSNKRGMADRCKWWIILWTKRTMWAFATVDPTFFTFDSDFCSAMPV